MSPCCSYLNKGSSSTPSLSSLTGKLKLPTFKVKVSVDFFLQPTKFGVFYLDLYDYNSAICRPSDRALGWPRAENRVCVSTNH